MDPAAGLAPTPAERARSAMRRCARAALTTENGTRHTVLLAHVDEDAGSVVLAVEAGDRDLGGRARLEVADEVLGSGPAAGVVRLWVEVAGPVVVPDGPTQRRVAQRIAVDCPDPALLGVGAGVTLVVVRPGAVTVVDHDGATAVTIDDLVTSGNDPFADIEGLWIEHLNTPACPVVRGIVRRLGARGLPGPAVLTALDRFGVVLTADDGEGTRRRVRVPFDDACVTVADLGRQIRLLVGCPRSPHALRPAPAGEAGRSRRLS